MDSYSVYFFFFFVQLLSQWHGLLFILQILLCSSYQVPFWKLQDVLGGYCSSPGEKWWFGARVVTMEMVAATHQPSALEVELIRPAGCWGGKREELRIASQASGLSKRVGCSEMEEDSVRNRSDLPQFDPLLGVHCFFRVTLVIICWS